MAKEQESGASHQMLERPNLGAAIRTLAAPARWYRYFNQAEHWVPNGKPPVQIAEMDLAWRLNCVRYLERNAARYAGLYADGCSAEEMVFGLAHPDAPEEIAEAMWRDAAFAKRDPVAWVKATKLYRALADGLPVKGAPLRKLADKAKHWGGCERRLFKKGACTCALLAAEARWQKELADQALAEATVPE